jgi:hypothetical protein
MNGLPRAKSFAGRLLHFYLLSVLRVCVPLPFLLTMQYLGGGVRKCVPMFFGWLALAIVYWWPVGTLLFLWKRGWMSRVLIGYLISLPLYFLCLLLIYPVFGGHFHPSSPAVWGIYFSQTPVYFAFTTFLYLLVRHENTVRRITSWLVAVVFAIGVSAPSLMGHESISALGRNRAQSA